MAKRKTESQRYRAPLSGQIIGAVVRELRLQDDVLKSKTAVRYFKGGRIKDDSKQEIFEVLGQALVAHNIIPPLPFLVQEGIPLAKVISSAITWYAQGRCGIFGGLYQLVQLPFAQPRRQQCLPHHRERVAPLCETGCRAGGRVRCECSVLRPSAVSTLSGAKSPSTQGL